MVTLEERVSRLEGAYEQVDRRLEELNQLMESLRAELRESNSALRAKMNSRFNNLNVIIVGSWITVIAGVIALFIKG